MTQAVLIADVNDDDLFGPLSSMGIKSLLPLVGKPLIDYALKQLEFSPVQELFVFASDTKQGITKHLKEHWSETRLDIKYIPCDGASCMGDFIRELDRRALVKGDFVLMTTDVVSNIDLAKVLQWHKYVLFCFCFFINLHLHFTIYLTLAEQPGIVTKGVL